MRPLNHFSFLRRDWQEIEIRRQTPELSWFDFENGYASSGILIWHILEDRIFLSEGFYRLLGMNKSGLLNLELLFWKEKDCEMRKYLAKILDQVYCSEIGDTSFKTKIPGMEKEIYGSVQLFDREEMGILDLMIICWI